MKYLQKIIQKIKIKHKSMSIKERYTRNYIISSSIKKENKRTIRNDKNNWKIKI